MSFRRDSYSILRICNILDGSITIDKGPILYSKQQNPVKYVKIYGIITDKTLDDSINQESGATDYLLKIDDGTGSLWVKSSSIHNENLQKWDFVRVIGYVTLDTANGKDYEIMIRTDTIFKINDQNWELVHILESNKGSFSQKQQTKPKNKQQKSPSINEGVKETTSKSKSASEEVQSEPEEPELESLTNKIERILREFDTGNGVEFSVIMNKIGSVDESEVDDILFELAYEGKVYQPRPDFYRIMD